MTPASTEPWRDGRRFYFFLSYAHSPPWSNDTGMEADFWVKAFFTDLCGRVRELADAGADLEAGFSNHLLRADPHWDVWTANALATAEVFVPLLEPGYLTRAWPMSQHDSFRRRLQASTSPRAREHILPVLWGPWVEPPGPDVVPELDAAMRLCGDVPAYADHGLRTLCMVSSFRRQYRTVLRILAGRIVELAQDAPIGPSRPPTQSMRVSQPRGATSFVVAVLAPNGTSLPPEREPAGYGASAEQWRPFTVQERPVADVVADLAESFGVQTSVVEYVAHHAEIRSRPGVILIDPWIAASPIDLQLLASALEKLPPWVIPIVVIDQADPQYATAGANMIDVVAELLSRHAGVRPRWLRGVHELAQLVPDVVNEATRKYVRHGQVVPPVGRSTPRPRITGPDDSTSRQPGTTDD
jgi:FxsC-like protein